MIGSAEADRGKSQVIEFQAEETQQTAAAAASGFDQNTKRLYGRHQTTHARPERLKHRSPARQP